MYLNNSKLLQINFWIVFLLSITLVSCKSPQNKNEEKVLTYAIGSDITSLDPVRVTEDNPRLISTQIMETLVFYDENMGLRPLLAESWTSFEEGKQWRFKLRPSVWFQIDSCFKGQNRTVNAYDVAYSLKRLLDPKTETLGAFILSDIVEGAADFVSGKATIVKGISVEDSLTLLFKLIKPYSNFPSRLSLPFAAIIPKEAVEYYGSLWGNHPVGSGPFKLSSWNITTGEIRLDMQSKYWKTLSTNLTGVRFLVSKSEASQLASFIQATTDVMEISAAVSGEVFTPDGVLKPKFKDSEVLTKPILTVHFIGFNFKRPLLRDQNFRYALNYAINKNELVNDVLNGMGNVANGALAPSLSGYNDTTIFAYNVDKAKKYLAASSYKGQELVYTTDNSTRSVAVAEYIKSQLDDIGVKLRIDKNPESVWITQLTEGNFDLGKLYFAFDYPSPDNGYSQFLRTNYAPTGPNFLRYSNLKFDQLYDKALKESNLSKASQIYREMNEIIRTDAPWIFLYYPTRSLLIGKSVEGIKLNNLSFSLFLDNVQLSK